MKQGFIIKDKTTGKYFIEVLPFIGSPFFGKKEEAKLFPTLQDAENKIALIGEKKSCLVEAIK